MKKNQNKTRRLKRSEMKNVLAGNLIEINIEPPCIGLTCNALCISLGQKMGNCRDNVCTCGLAYP